jgi:hypothetical protein
VMLPGFPPYPSAIVMTVLSGSNATFFLQVQTKPRALVGPLALGISAYLLCEYDG